MTTQTANRSRFISELVDRSRGSTSYSEQELLNATTQFIEWASGEGLALERETLFTEPVIQAFALGGMPQLKEASRANRRAMLRRMAEVLVPCEQVAVRLSSADAQRPYMTKSEQNRLRRWIAVQSEDQRLDASALLALGLGAGLTASEIANLRAKDVTRSRSGVQVAVGGAAPRVVPMLAKWEGAVLATAAERRPDQFLIRPARSGVAKNWYNNLVARSTLGTSHGPNSQRARATWLVHHLEAQVPVQLLIHAAGLASLDGLSRYLPYLRPVRPGHQLDLLRGGDPARGSRVTVQVSVCALASGFNSLRSPRPEIRIKTALQFGNRRQVGPRRPLQHDGDRRVVHAGERSDLAKTASTHPLAKVDREASGDLRYRVVST